MATTIKTNHPFTKLQLVALNKELEKISNVKIALLRGFTIPAKDNYADIEILHSPYSLDVYLSFMDIANPDNPKAEMYQISASGVVDYKTRSTSQFHTLADRVHFFNTLSKVEFNY